MKKVILILSLVIGYGCTTDLDLAPMDSPSEATFWRTEEDARIYLNTLYADLWNADAYLFFNALSDDAYTKGREDYRNIASGNYDSSNGVVEGTWASRYEGIRRTNIFLNNIDRVEDISEEERKSYTAQARFVRAWHYFYLIELYGDVPLVTDEISIEESLQLQRTNNEIVLEFIYDELEMAIENLPPGYPADQAGRITKDAAIAFKSRVHLYNQEYQAVVELLEPLIGKYDLYPNYDELFETANEYNEEIFLSLQYVPSDREHNIQYSLVPPSMGGYANFSPLQSLVDTYLTIEGHSIDDPEANYDENTPYQNRDPRLTATIIYDDYVMEGYNGNQVTINTSPGAAPDGLNYSSNSTPTGYYVSKYFDPEARNQVNSGLNLILIRYAEVLLNYAEAKIELGTFSEQDWNSTIRRIRQRAGLIGQALEYPGNDQQNLRELVRNERRVELAFEAGHRFFDIRRWEIADDVLSGWTYGMRTEDGEHISVSLRSFDPGKHFLWPIPLSERTINNNLTQNPNW